MEEITEQKLADAKAKYELSVALLRFMVDNADAEKITSNVKGMLDVLERAGKMNNGEVVLSLVTVTNIAIAMLVDQDKDKRDLPVEVKMQLAQDLRNTAALAIVEATEATEDYFKQSELENYQPSEKELAN